MKNDAPDISRISWIFLLAAILFLDKKLLFMFGFMNTFIHMTRYVMYKKINLKVT